MKRLAKCELNELLNSVRNLNSFDHIDNEKIAILVSKGSRSSAYAKIYGLCREFQLAFKMSPLYVIEFSCEKVSTINPEELFIIFIHELLHIPKRFTGGLRPHGKYVNNSLARRISNKIRYHLKIELYERLHECCDRLI